MDIKRTIAVVSLTILPTTAWSLELPTRDAVQKLIDYAWLENIYHDLHRYPELSNHETRTSKQIAKELKSLGLEVTEGIGGNGLVGVFQNGEGPVGLIRTELDALPVQEETDLPYRSENPGVMHACGHDMHMAIFLGVAAALVHLKESWKGTLLFVAQPAEELGTGAKAMVEDPLFNRLPKADYALALHVIGELLSGLIAYHPGYTMASSDAITMTLFGRGGHGAFPHKAIDPIHLAAEVLIKLQTIIPREIDALDTAVISAGSIHGGTKSNIIPDSVQLQLTLRTFDVKVKEGLKKRILEVANGLASLAGAPVPKIEYGISTPAIYNDPRLTEKLIPIFKTSVGNENVHSMKAIMGSEDFGVFSQAGAIPSVMFYVGQQKHGEKGPFPFNHSPKFAPDLKPALTAGITAMVLSVIRLASDGATHL